MRDISERPATACLSLFLTRLSKSQISYGERIALTARKSKNLVLGGCLPRCTSKISSCTTELIGAMFFFVSDTLKQLNQSADPCTDFYEFACGGWENENALEPGETSVTGFSLVREKSYNVLKQALENAEKNYSSVRKCLNFVSQGKGVNVIIIANSAQTSS